MKKFTFICETPGYKEDILRVESTVSVDDTATVSRMCAYFSDFLNGCGYRVRKDQLLGEDQ